MKPLKGLSFNELIELREAADRLILERATAQRKQLEEQLARLTQVTSKISSAKHRADRGRPSVSRARGATKRKGKKRNKVNPKYINPADPSQTWAGRGNMPRWLRAFIAQ